jgi:hypothetical protein
MWLLSLDGVNMIRHGRMYIRQRVWVLRFNPNFSTNYVRLRDEKNKSRQAGAYLVQVRGGAFNNYGFVIIRSAPVVS